MEESKLQQVAEIVQNQDGPMDVEALREKTDLSERKMAKALNRLEDAGALETLPTEEVELAEDAPDLASVAKKAAEEQERRHDAQTLRIEKMRAYAEMTSCRREYLLEYFGESTSRCENCDNCERPASSESRPA